MKKYLFYIVKYVRWIYSLYFYMGNLFMRLLEIFVKPDDKLILFISFGGRKFDDSPKAIYDEMLQDARFKDYKLVWAFTDPTKFSIPVGEKIKTDTLTYFITALKARVWITNSTVERGLSFKGKHTLYFNTWHGTPLKKMGEDISQNSKSFRGKGKATYDVFLAQGEYEAEVFSRAFKIDNDKIYVIGLPRNDVYSAYSKESCEMLKSKLNIPKDKKVVLYAPTFREYEADATGQRTLSIPVDFENWRKRLSDDWVVLFRAHYEVAKVLKIQDDEFLRDMSSYPSLEDLMIVADVLISDYSSMFFDYSVMHKPMLCFAYDYERYAKERGMYFDIREYLPFASKESELLRLIEDSDKVEYAHATKRFQEKFVTAYGTASKQSLDLIHQSLG